MQCGGLALKACSPNNNQCKADVSFTLFSATSSKLYSSIPNKEIIENSVCLHLHIPQITNYYHIGYQKWLGIVVQICL